MAAATLAPPCAAYEVDPLKCTRCGTIMRIIALIDDAGVVERILKHLDAWDPQPDTLSACRSRVFQPLQPPPLRAMHARSPFELGDQLRHVDSTLVSRASQLDDAIEFPILCFAVNLD